MGGEESLVPQRTCSLRHRKKGQKSLLLAVWKPFNWVPDKLQLVAVPSDEKKKTQL